MPGQSRLVSNMHELSRGTEPHGAPSIFKLDIVRFRYSSIRIASSIRIILHFGPLLKYFRLVMAESGHVPLRSLWEMVKENGLLSPEAMRHIDDCKDCLSAIGMCQLWNTYEEAERALSRHRSRLGRT